MSTRQLILCLKTVGSQAQRKFRYSGMLEEAADEASAVLLHVVEPALSQHWEQQPPQVLLDNHKQPIAPIRQMGYVLVRVDRNTGHHILPIKALQRTTFLHSNRYCITDEVPSHRNPDYRKSTVASFSQFVFFNFKQRPKTLARLRAISPSSRDRYCNRRHKSSKCLRSSRTSFTLAGAFFAGSLTI